MFYATPPWTFKKEFGWTQKVSSSQASQLASPADISKPKNLFKNSWLCNEREAERIFKAVPIHL